VHEIGLVTATAAALAREADGVHVGSVHVALGPRVNFEVAAAAWSEAVSGTALAEAHVTWEAAFDELCCFTCGRVYKGRFLDPCPDCGGNGLVVTPADEVTVTGWSPG
jgi:hydrogenase nickel incorporation protein HypA/HybF